MINHIHFKTSSGHWQVIVPRATLVCVGGLAVVSFEYQRPSIAWQICHQMDLSGRTRGLGGGVGMCIVFMDAASGY